MSQIHESKTTTEELDEFTVIETLTLLYQKWTDLYNTNRYLSCHYRQT